MNWRRFLRRDETDAEQRQELEFYLNATAEESMARGMNPDAAREAARKKLGNLTLIREEVYQMNTLMWLEGLLRDGRHALRMIRLNPGSARLRFFRWRLALARTRRSSPLCNFSVPPDLIITLPTPLAAIKRIL